MNIFEELKKGTWIPNTVAVCAGVVLYLALTHIGIIGVFASSVWSLVSPLVLGVILAYLLDPIVCFFERKGIKRKFSVIATLGLILLILTLMTVALLPQLSRGMLQFVENFGGYVQSLQGQLQALQQPGDGGNGALTEPITKILNNLAGLLTSANLASLSGSVGGSVGTFLMGFVLAVYFLISKKEIVTWVLQFVRKVLGEERFKHLSSFCKRVNRILLSYISCSLMEAIIVGCVNAVFMMGFRMPYVSVISCIVAITNLAPTFGPIVGCILGMFILLLAKPGAVIWFLLFTIVLQAIDGYVIKPKLFGDTLGVSPLLILIFLVTGSRLLGVWGLLLAIPVSAILQYIFQEILFPYTNKRREEADGRKKTATPRKQNKVTGVDIRSTILKPVQKIYSERKVHEVQPMDSAEYDKSNEEKGSKIAGKRQEK